MKDKLSVLRNFQPLFFLIYMACAFCALCGFLIAVVSCIDRADEWFNALRYQTDWRVNMNFYHNEWAPFKGGFIDRVMQIPHGLYIGFTKFTMSAMVGLLLFPVLIFVIPAYDLFLARDFGFLLYAWAPVIVSGAVFACTVILHESSKLDKKGIESVKLD